MQSVWSVLRSDSNLTRGAGQKSKRKYVHRPRVCFGRFVRLFTRSRPSCCKSNREEVVLFWAVDCGSWIVTVLVLAICGHAEYVVCCSSQRRRRLRPSVENCSLIPFFEVEREKNPPKKTTTTEKQARSTGLEEKRRQKMQDEKKAARQRKEGKVYRGSRWEGWVST